MNRYREISQYRKSFDVVTNYVHYPIATFLCTLLSYTSVTPNQITALAVIVELSAAMLIVQGEKWNLILATLLLQLGWIFDLMDGMLARYKKTGYFSEQSPSLRGYYWDAVSDHTLKFIILGALTFHYAQYSHSGWVLGVLAIVVHGITQTEHTLQKLIINSGESKESVVIPNTGIFTQSALILNNIYLFYLLFLPLNRIDLFFIFFAGGEAILFMKRILQFHIRHP